MKFIFAVLDESLTMGLTRCYKTEGFFYIYLSYKPILKLKAPSQFKVGLETNCRKDN